MAANQPAVAKEPHRPRPLSDFVVFAFGSTRESLAAEATLITADIDVRVIPLPPHRGRLCGVALRVRPDHEPAAAEALRQNGIAVAARDEIQDY